MKKMSIFKKFLRMREKTFILACKHRRNRKLKITILKLGKQDSIINLKSRRKWFNNIVIEAWQLPVKE